MVAILKGHERARGASDRRWKVADLSSSSGDPQAADDCRRTSERSSRRAGGPATAAAPSAPQLRVRARRGRAILEKRGAPMTRKTAVEQRASQFRSGCSTY